MAHLINRVTIGIANNTRSNYSENHAPDYNYTYTGPAPKRVAGKEQKYHFKIKKKKNHISSEDRMLKMFARKLIQNLKP